MRVELEILRYASPSLFVRKVRAEGGEDAIPFLVGHLLAGVASPRDLRDLVACDTAEAINHPSLVPPANPDWTTSPAACPGWRAP